MKGFDRRAVLLAATMLGSTVTAAHAQETAATDTVDHAGIQDIIVTAQKREQRLQDVPIAVSALTADALQANRIVNVRDLDGLTPGLTVRPLSGGIGAPSYSMRGLTTTGDQAGRDRGIGLYLDGVYIANAFGSMMSLPDIERIEVLRGPQGTLFGRNSNGGAVSVTTRQPTGEFGAKQTISVGNYDQLRTATSISLPSFGPFSAIGSFVYSKRRGDIRNLGANTVWDFTRAFNGKSTLLRSSKYLGNDDSSTFFGAIKGDFDTVKMIYRFDHSSTEATSSGEGVSYVSPGLAGVLAAQPAGTLLTPISNKRPDAVNNWATVPAHLKATGHSLTTTWDATDNVTVTDIAAYRRTTVQSPLSQVDGLGGLVYTGGSYLSALVQPAAARQLGEPLLITGGPNTNNSYKQWSNELQVNIQTQLATLTIGGLYFRQNADFSGTGVASALGYAKGGSYVVYPDFQVPGANPALQGGRTTEVRTRSLAAFGQAEIHVTDNFDVVGGIRYTKDKKWGTDRSIVSVQRPTQIFPIEYSKGKATFSLGANYKPTQDILLYGKYGTSFISGGVSAEIAYDPETAKSWEAGIKADWLDRKVRTNLALYTVKYNDLQQTPSTRNVPDYAYLAALGVGTIVLNAGSAKAKGFEFETIVAPSSAFTFTGNLAYLDFKYTYILPALKPTGAEFLPSSRPKWTSALSGQYTSPELGNGMHLTARIDGTWRSRQFGNASIPVAGSAAGGGAAFTPAEVAAYKKATIIKPYWIVNGRLALNGFELGRTKSTVALWGRNLFDNKSMTFPIGFVSHVSALYEAARTYGLDVTVEF